MVNREVVDLEVVHFEIEQHFAFVAEHH